MRESLACLPLLAHLKTVLGGVSGVGVVKGSSSNLGRCHMAKRRTTWGMAESETDTRQEQSRETLRR